MLWVQPSWVMKFVKRSLRAYSPRMSFNRQNNEHAPPINETQNAHHMLVLILMGELDEGDPRTYYSLEA